MIDNPIDDLLDADDIEEFKKFDVYSSATNIDWLLQKSIESDSHKITAYICEHYNPNYQSQRSIVVILAVRANNLPLLRYLVEHTNADIYTLDSLAVNIACNLDDPSIIKYFITQLDADCTRFLEGASLRVAVEDIIESQRQKKLLENIIAQSSKSDLFKV